MTDHHHPQMSVAPDAGRAEELRRLLHARLASGHRDVSVSITPADTDPDDQEGDLIMLETEDRPAGHEPPTPRRRSPGSWLLVAAAVAVVAILGGLLVAAAGDDDETRVPASETSTTAPARDVMEVPDFEALPVGRYFVDPDGDDATPLRVTYEVAEEGWSQWLGAVKFTDNGHTGVSITTVDNLVTQACTDHTPADPPVGPGVDDLATALAELEPFDVSEAPSDVTVHGYQGKHLRLTVPEIEVRPTGGGEAEYADCTDGNLESWIAKNSGGAFFGYNAEPGGTEDFWILDVDGQRLVLTIQAFPSSPAGDVAEAQAIFDSIQIEP